MTTEKKRMENYNKQVPWDPKRSTPVFITSIDIPLGDVFVLLLKIAVAAIPVGIVVGVGYLILTLIFAVGVSLF